MKKLTLILSMLLVAAVSTTAVRLKHRHKAKTAPATVVNVDASDAQRTKFFTDAINPMGAK